MASPSQFLKLRNEEQSNRVQDNVAATLTPIATALNATPIMGAAPPPWSRPNLLLDFVNVTGFATVGFHRDALGYVHIKGRVSTAAGHVAFTPVFRLPVGYRLLEQQRFAVEGTGGTAQFAVVTPEGYVSPSVNIAAGGAMSLAFSFLAEG